MSQHYPEVKVNNFHIDILTAHFGCDQIFWWVGNNLFGDIPSDLGPACTGTLAIPRAQFLRHCLSQYTDPPPTPPAKALPIRLARFGSVH